LDEDNVKPFDPVVDALNEEEKEKLLAKVKKQGKRQLENQTHVADIVLKD
jgi:hypothetical protein